MRMPERRKAQESKSLNWPASRREEIAGAPVWNGNVLKAKRRSGRVTGNFHSIVARNKALKRKSHGR